MKTKTRKITDTQFKLGVSAIIILFIGLLYFAVIEDRMRVQEYDGFVENPIISPTHPLTYETEFCASKLTDLAHEIHFLEREIERQEGIAEKGSELLKGEESIVEIEQREISEVREEFDEYRAMCIQFDIKPTRELCSKFLSEAKNNLGLAQENAESAESKGIIEMLQIQLQDLRKAKRIYENLQAKCEGVE